MRSVRILLPFVLAVLAMPPARGTDGWLASMVHLHEGDAPAAGTATAPADTSGRDIVYATLDGKPVTGYLAPAEPAAGAPAIIVIQEWWGLNDNIRGLARDLATAGYTALAVDLYEGTVATESGDAQKLVEAAMAAPDRLLENLRQAHGYLTGTLGAAEVGVIGWCFGGGWALETALTLGDGIDAAVVYYGWVETDPERIAMLSAPVLGHFGTLDEGFARAREFEAVARAAGKDATIYAYEGADHAFANPAGTLYPYHPEAARLAWERTLEFFAEHLGG
jgi:carboxymethylenebutenolidase